MRAELRDGSEATVYRIYDADGRLLYVGMSINAVQRLAAHRYQQEWWPRVARVDIEHFVGRKAAARAEALAIETEAPEFNVNPGRCVGHDVWPRRGIYAARNEAEEAA